MTDQQMKPFAFLVSPNAASPILKISSAKLSKLG